MLTLFPNEREILTSNENKIILTDKRIHMSDKELGHSFSITIFLENISSTQVLYKSNTLFSALTGISLLGAILNYFIGGKYGYNNYDSFYFVIATIVFFALWWSSKKHVISINSDGGSALIFEVSDLKETQIQHFVETVQLAKANRMNSLHNIR